MALHCLSMSKELRALTLPQIFAGLHNTDDSKTVEMLNRATYIKYYRVPQNTLMLHTGFSCQVQTGKVFEFLCDVGDFNSVQLVFQVKNPGIHLPQIAGLMVSKSGGQFYRLFHTFVLTAISSCSQYIRSIQPSSQEINFNKLSHKLFTVYSKDDNSVIAEYPITKFHETEFFTNGETFYYHSDQFYSQYRDLDEGRPPDDYEQRSKLSDPENDEDWFD